jgi:hypothetical protein
MPTEKYGALWHDDGPASGWVLAQEQFEPSRELLGVVFSKAGMFKSSVFEKKADHQWRLPWWSEVRPEALFNSQEEALAHVRARLANVGA